jgi:hypothetical protein
MRRLFNALALSAACAQPDPLVICHNANCNGQLDVHRDDTLEALASSLEVTVSGRPAFDGIEIDTVWKGDQDRCTYTHAFRAAAPDAQEAADAIAAWLLAADIPTWNRELFILKIELKAVVGPSLEQHDGAQERQHAECALDVAWTVLDAATAAGVEVEVIADSSDDGLLREVASRPRWREIPRRRLSADFGAPRPFTPDTPRLSDFAGVPLDLIEFHPGWLPDAGVEAFRSLDVDFILWMFSATPEQLAAIRTYQPEYVNTSEAELMRRWIER